MQADRETTAEQPVVGDQQGFVRRLSAVVRRRSQRLGSPILEASAPLAIARRDQRLRHLLALADLISAAVALAVAVLIGEGTRLTAPAIFVLPLVVLISKVIGLYDRDVNRLQKTTLDEAPSLFQVAAVATLVVVVAQHAIMEGPLDRHQVVGLWGTLFAAMLLSRASVRKLEGALSPAERCIVVGDATSAELVRRKLATTHDCNGVVVGWVPMHAGQGSNSRNAPPRLGSMQTLGLVLVEHEIERVIIVPSSHDSEDMLDAIRLVKSLGVKVSLLPRLLEVVGSAVEVDDVSGVLLLGVRGYGLPRSSQMLKRSFDIAVAGGMLFLFAPLMIAIAIAIKLDSKGPALFRQTRIGRGGESFVMMKFRTMVEGAEDMKDALRRGNETDGLFKIARDPRVTRVGSFLRRTALDELPQLLNVVRGEMSLVGPRPLVPDEDRRVGGWQRRRLTVTPGITGPWQILGPSRVPMHEMVKIDYLYGANWTLWRDLKILLRTVPHAFARRGL